MNSFTHVLIGKILLKQLEDRYGITLDRRAFLYGSVLPDFRRFYKSLRHKKHCWEGYIKSEIHELIRHEKTGRCFDSATSRRLGVICHFYADFFCLAHTDSFEGSTYRHIKYEWALGRRLRENAVRLYRAELGVKTLPELCPEGIYGDFQLLQNKYFECSPDFMRDLTFTLRACAGAVTAIAESSAVTQDNSPPLKKAAGSMALRSDRRREFRLVGKTVKYQA